MKNSTMFLTIILVIIFSSNLFAQSDFQNAKVDFDSYQKLVAEVNDHRQSRLIDLNTFLEMSKEDGVIILDARSERMYFSKHIKGAVNLNFSEFTQETLAELIPTTNTKILIYCNNNFEDDAVNFPTKMFIPDLNAIDSEPLLLALNVPTYINLFGYGYRNIYELSELISVSDNRVEFAGNSVSSSLR